MKKIYFLALGFILSLGLSAQTLISSDDFDSYTSGNYVALQNTTLWTTWSNLPGNATEDALVSSTQAFSGANSAYIQNDNDLVLKLNDKTTGRYQLEFEVFIESGHGGYFNVLQDFNGTNSKWGMQIWFKPNGTTKVDAGADSSAGFNFNFDQWYNVNFIIDVDDDFATMYFDNNEIVSWKWSGGSFGDGTTHKLDAADFYGDGSTYGTSGMYIDDVVFNEMPVPEAPINLTANYNGSDNDIAWNSPTTTPDSYILTANSNVLAQGMTDTTYTDVNPYPGSYTYNVRAQYNGLGYSHSSNDAIAVVPGGVNRDWVVFEVGTGTWCTYCPAAAMACEDMETNGDSAASIEYHSDGGYTGADIFMTPTDSARLRYYNVTAFPTGIADGTLRLEGGNHTTSFYPYYHQMYLERKAKQALFTINLTPAQTGTYNYSVQIDMEQISDYLPGNKKLFTALTESNIAYSWQGQTQLDFVDRLLLPDENGINLDFSSQTTQTQTVNFSLDPTWVKDNCQLVVFLQDAATDEIVQAEKIDLATVVSNPTVETVNAAIYPNPANNTLYVNTKENSNYQIVNLLGQSIQSGQLTNTLSKIDISSLPAGVYFINITNGQAVQKVKFVKE